jgi:hypothetical protein
MTLFSKTLALLILLGNELIEENGKNKNKILNILVKMGVHLKHLYSKKMIKLLFLKK